MELDSLEARSWISAKLDCPQDAITLTPLGGGVSNHVILVEAPGLRCVFKQALEKLRVEQDWRSGRDRIFRECAVLRAVRGILPLGAVPRVLLEAPEHFTFAMEVAPADAQPWKSPLLAGEVRLEWAEMAGHLLGTWIRESVGRPDWRAEFAGLTVFGELRVDPYYRTTAARHPELARHFASLIDECVNRRFSLVHGDFSPKNLLISSQGMMVIDWEVVHWGDPSFDAAFLTNHLLLKAFHRPAEWRQYQLAATSFWRALCAVVEPEWLPPAAMRHLGCLLLARVDGKSPAEYIQTEALRQRVRAAAIDLIHRPAANAAEAFERAFS
ncbi:MAG: aminoglycoside phosphotransferase family protein [Bryobacterales bacterium]|nr:aminoglycoside phosphotransferase family protein [Bryobacterales bacterium]